MMFFKVRNQFIISHFLIEISRFLYLLCKAHALCNGIHAAMMLDNRRFKMCMAALSEIRNRGKRTTLRYNWQESRLNVLKVLPVSARALPRFIDWRDCIFVTRCVFSQVSSQ